MRLRQEDDFFRPTCLVVLGGQFLRITNNGTTVHNFTVEGTDLDVDVDASSHLTTEVIGQAVGPGTHRFFCKYHVDAGMEGELTVTAAG
ncbi:MAG: cupredoxin domain-containing protein [Actinomycetota bacterium]